MKDKSYIWLNIKLFSMKQIIFFSSLFVFSLLVSCGETKEDAKEETKASFVSIKIQEIGLEVMTKDLGKMRWEEAIKACENLGDGWRLPTIEELEEIYKYEDKIVGIANNFYWSSTEYGNYTAWSFNFNSGTAYFSTNKNYANYVRAVRALK